MADPTELSDLVAYLARTTRLTPSEAAHVVGEVMSFLSERPEEFVCRRHRSLQAEGIVRFSSASKTSWRGGGSEHPSTRNAKFVA